MALHLNLLHEQIAAERQRQRDPLKIGMLVLIAVGALMVVFYMWKGYGTLETKSRLAALQRDWAKVEPDVTAAQKRSAELNGIINTTRVLDTMIEGRFFWGPLLQKLSLCVAPNAQLTSIDGTFAEENGLVTLSIEGIAAGREPRSAAEELRQLLSEQLGQSYKDVKVEFKSLEDLDTIVKVLGTNMAMARYSLSVSFVGSTVESSTAATTAPAPAVRTSKK
ncbi:MAG TPA: hypothetical protein VF551_03970 [Chthoniobacterales bacterium]